MRMPSSRRSMAWGTGGSVAMLYNCAMTTRPVNPHGTRGMLRADGDTATIFRLAELARRGIAELDRLPFSIRVLLENALRHAGRGLVTEEHVGLLARWAPASGGRAEIP